jgi:hypothetical protein
VRRQAEDFDFLHFHLDYFPFSLFSRQPTPFITTLHGRQFERGRLKHREVGGLRKFGGSKPANRRGPTRQSSTESRNRGSNSQEDLLWRSLG